VKLLAHFDSFLKETVNLNQRQLDLLDARVQSIVVEVGLDDVIGPMLEGYIPQGSWAHRTIIKPLAGREFDADFLLHLTEQAEWADHPTSYLDEVEAAFRRSPRYGDKVRRKTRCVRIVYADDCHVDVVPYLVRSDGSQVIVCRDTDDFEATDPEGFTAWMKEKDDQANGNLRRVIRLLKYLRDYKTTFSCPSVLLTTLVGERVLALDADNRYPDVPTALKTLVADLDAWLQLRPTMPSIEDPSCPGTTFDHRWDADKYANFRTQIHRYAVWIATAYDEPDRDKSLTAWQTVFGPDFEAPVTAAPIAESALTKVAPAGAQRAPREEFITERFPLDVRYTATITGRVLPRAGFRSGLIRNLGRLTKQRDLRFKVVTDVPWSYDVYWKVRNYGTEAEQANGLRGELARASDPRGEHKESTLYAGAHWIECYVVKDCRVLATDRHRVEIG
jgi:hypothetical protein